MVPTKERVRKIKAVELIGEVNAKHQLQARVPRRGGSRRVRRPVDGHTVICWCREFAPGSPSEAGCFWV